MTAWRWAVLEDRGVVSVSGEDAGKLLQGIVTNDMDLLATQPAIHAALLTPQGKMLLEFFVVNASGGFLLETARDKTGDLVKRLSMYKLRAKVAIEDRSRECAVLAGWGAPTAGSDAAGVVFPDPRLAALGQRRLVPRPIGSSEISATAAEYHAHRIALGVPEGGKDYVPGDTFPHEALLDQLHGVSFTKGCYVGQEVVSRMEHRSTARKRVVPVVGTADLPSGPAAVKAGDVAIGALGSVAGHRGLALVRLDRAEEFAAKGVTLSAGGVPVRIELPAFARFSLAPAEHAAP